MGQIKSAGDLRSRVEIKKVMTPEWGEDGDFVHARGLSPREYEKWQSSNLKQVKGEPPRATLDTMKGSTARLVILGTCDENGEPLFAMSDLNTLLDMNNRALNRVALVIQELTGIGDEEELVEEAAENFASTPTSSSPTDWPHISE